MARIRFQGDTDKYPLDPKIEYDIDFRSEGILVFVDVHSLRGELITSCVFPSVSQFLDSFVFEEGRAKPKLVRNHTDFETSLYFSSGEAAQFLGVSPQTIKNWAVSGKLPVHHEIPPRGDRRFKRDDCVALLDAQTSGAY